MLAHRKKKLHGAGLDALRETLDAAGVTDPLWYEVNKSKKAPKRARKAVDAGAELVLVWGGDGMTQRSVDALAGSGVTVGLLPAGTANLLASNLGIPTKLAEAVQIALHGNLVAELADRIQQRFARQRSASPIHAFEHGSVLSYGSRLRSR